MHVESFKAVRWIRTLNLVLQALLFTTFFIGLNYLALHYHLRKDLTQARRYSLSQETLAYLHTLPHEVSIVVTFSEEFPDDEAEEDIRNLLREYSYATEGNVDGNRINVEYLDIVHRPREARARGIEEADAIHFICGNKRRAVRPEELYQRSNGAKVAFRGEQVFTASILDVAAAEQKKVYFLTGHGELRIDDVNPMTGLSELANELRLRNFAVETLDISAMRKVPDDASLVIVAAPEKVEPFAQEQLRQYLANRTGNQAGSVIVFLATRVPHGMDELFFEWGVWAHDVIICDTNPESVTEEHDLKIGAYLPHPITQTLIERKLYLRLGEARCINPSPDKLKGSGLTITTLAATASTAWGERNYRSQRPYAYDEGTDLKGNASTIPPGCLGVAVSSERMQSRGNLTFSVKGGRLVVFGAADLAVNDRIRGTPGNQHIVLNAINWAVDRDTQLAISPRPIERFQLTLSQDELLRLRYTLWFGLPGLAACLGLIVYWTRRT